MTDPASSRLEVSESHHAVVGEFEVRRALPRRARRTVGAWCFADHMVPTLVGPTTHLIGPHPHCGLQTVTWLIEGEVLHRDSLGTEQRVRAGQLNLMTSGEGVSHSEEATGDYRGVLEGIQMWIASPEATRHGDAGFQHLAGLPRVDLSDGVATVLCGSFAGATSPARVDTPLVGLDLDLRGGDDELRLRADFEHAVIVLRGELTVEGTPLAPGRMGYLAPGLERLRLEPSGPARAVMIGGEPFAETLLMWWNFVARTREEIDRAYAEWSRRSSRFGEVASELAPIDTLAPYWQPVSVGRVTD